MRRTLLKAPLLTVAALVGVLLTGCQTIPGQSAAETAEATRVARAHLDSGEYALAAEEYLRLSVGAQEEVAREYRLDAALAFILAERLDAAREILDDVGDEPLSESLEIKRNLVLAELALAERQPAEALALLATEPGADIPEVLKVRFHRLRADAYEQAGDYIESSRERVQLELLLSDPVAASENRRHIWESLAKLSPHALEAAYVPPPSTLGGWIELAVITRETITDSTTLGQAIALWRNRYPGHPAGEEIVPMLVEASSIQWAPPRTVALLLPLEGQFEKAARAVRDGFMAAWFDDADNPYRPTVLVRDTSGGDTWNIFDKAVEDGAEFVVGPLRRTAVTSLARRPSLPVPTLALNFADVPPDAGDEPGAEPEGVTPGGLFQFALSPESEARLVAEHAWFAGYSNAAVLAPEGTWGTRVADAFSNEWEDLGGQVVERQAYGADGVNMAQPVKQLLNVDESDSRYRSLKKILGADLKQEPRRRRDVDFVFMAAFPRQARQLRPQLEFHRGQDLPVYSTSHIYAGVPEPALDADIDGVVFGDMPWVLDPERAETGLRGQVDAQWKESIAGLVRLYAFGADAYRLIKELGRLRAQRYAEYHGVTGRLSLNEHNRVDRRLIWARFKRGVPRILENTLAVEP
jgi:outer membrane PBP1 activator LpoA protein